MEFHLVFNEIHMEGEG